MIERSISDLQFVSSNNPVPTVEIDLDSIPADFLGYDSLVIQALLPIASASPNMKATFYVYEGPSVNFHTQTYSAFIGVAGKESLLEPLFVTFEKIHGIKAKFSDSIVPSTNRRQYHIQEGQVWSPNDQLTWYARSEDELLMLKLPYPHIEDKSEACDINDTNTYIMPFRVSTPTRYRVA